MLSDENVYHNPFNAPYGVYPANEESLRHAARMDQDQYDAHREALLRPLESTPDGYYICKPILSDGCRPVPLCRQPAQPEPAARKRRQPPAAGQSPEKSGRPVT